MGSFLAWNYRAQPKHNYAQFSRVQVCCRQFFCAQKNATLKLVAVQKLIYTIFTYIIADCTLKTALAVIKTISIKTKLQHENSWKTYEPLQALRSNRKWRIKRRRRKRRRFPKLNEGSCRTWMQYVNVRSTSG